MATSLRGRDDILIHAVANNHNLIGLHTKSLDTESEYLRVGFTYTHHSALYDGIEDAIELKLLKHGGYVAIEITYQHHGILLFKRKQHLATFTCLGNCCLVQVRGER